VKLTPDSNASGAMLCDLCETPATAVWHGRNTVHVCSRCGQDVLPALAADALLPFELVDPHRIIDRILFSFWRALALRLRPTRKSRRAAG
jgi:hypothetical protein